MTDIPRMLSYFKMTFVINLVLCTIEYAMGYRGDNIGGMFGTTSGCNGYLNLFLIIIVAISMIEYLNKTRSIGELVYSEIARGIFLYDGNSGAQGVRV